MILVAAASLLSSSALGFHPAQQCSLSPADQWQNKAELGLPCLKGMASSLGAEGPGLPDCIKLVPTDTFLPFKLCLFWGGVFLCSPTCPDTTAQAVSPDCPTSTSQVLGLHLCQHAWLLPPSQILDGEPV